MKDLKPEDYLEAVLYLITTPDAFSRKDADTLMKDAVHCLQGVFGREERSVKLWEAVIEYLDYRRHEVEQAQAGEKT